MMLVNERSVHVGRDAESNTRVALIEFYPPLPPATTAAATVVTDGDAAEVTQHSMIL